MTYKNGQYWNKIWNGLQLGHPFMQILFRYDPIVSR
jgi:hypothetical protein